MNTWGEWALLVMAVNMLIITVQLIRLRRRIDAAVITRMAQDIASLPLTMHHKVQPVVDERGHPIVLEPGSIIVVHSDRHMSQPERDAIRAELWQRNITVIILPPGVRLAETNVRKRTMRIPVAGGSELVLDADKIAHMALEANMVGELEAALAAMRMPPTPPPERDVRGIG